MSVYRSDLSPNYRFKTLFNLTRHHDFGRLFAHLHVVQQDGVSDECESNARSSIHPQTMLPKEEPSTPERGGDLTKFSQTWAVLVGKCNQGAGQVHRTIQPKKQSRGWTRDREEIARNKGVSLDRVFGENYFGRMCALWKASYVTLKCNENRFDTIARLCVALANFHVGLMPLRSRDSDHYDIGSFEVPRNG
jgi:hypothetical protein